MLSVSHTVSEKFQVISELIMSDCKSLSGFIRESRGWRTNPHHQHSTTVLCSWKCTCQDTESDAVLRHQLWIHILDSPSILSFMNLCVNMLRPAETDMKLLGVFIVLSLLLFRHTWLLQSGLHAYRLYQQLFAGVYLPHCRKKAMRRCFFFFFLNVKKGHLLFQCFHTKTLLKVGASVFIYMRRKSGVQEYI